MGLNSKFFKDIANVITNFTGAKGVGVDAGGNDGLFPLSAATLAAILGYTPASAADLASYEAATNAAINFNQTTAIGEVSEYNPTTGQTISVAPSGLFRAALINPAGGLAALTLNVTANAANSGAAMFVTFTQSITTLTWGSTASSTGGLALPSSITAPQTILLWWKQSASKWVRFL